MKKRIVLTVIITCTILFSQAQITKGTLLIGGNAGFNSTTIESENNGTTFESKANSFSISPSIGKAFKENTVKGINASFTYSRSVAGNSTDQYSGLLGVFIRKYAPLGKGFFIYGQGSVNGNYSVSRVYSSQVNKVALKAAGIGAAFDAGLSYKISNKVMLEVALGSLASFGYSHQWQDLISGPPVSETKTNTFYFNSGLNLINLGNASVGFRILIPS